VPPICRVGGLAWLRPRSGPAGAAGPIPPRWSDPARPAPVLALPGANPGAHIGAHIGADP
jgi:hypothetical protein